MGREENKEIFQDTEKLCRTNPALIQAWKSSSEKQKLILESESVIYEKQIYETPTKIIISKKRTFEAAMDYPGKKVAVLNFASASNPGGGVVNGSSAQEECLCRCSTLYCNLTEDFMWKNFYQPHRHTANPIHNDDLIYTPDVVIFKSDTPYPRLFPTLGFPARAILIFRSSPDFNPNSPQFFPDPGFAGQPPFPGIPVRSYDFPDCGNGNPPWYREPFQNPGAVLPPRNPSQFASPRPRNRVPVWPDTFPFQSLHLSTGSSYPFTAGNVPKIFFSNPEFCDMMEKIRRETYERKSTSHHCPSEGSLSGIGLCAALSERL